MSRITPLQRKSALIRRYLEMHASWPGSTRDHIDLLAGMTRAGFEKWMRGDVMDPNKKAEVSARIKAALQIDDPRNVLDDDFGVMELGERLGLSRSQCQQAIDMLAGEHSPTFTAFMMEPGLAETILKSYRGLYVLYRLEETDLARQLTGRPRSIMCMTMSVRFRLSGSKTLSRGLERVRCKLNVPAYRLDVERHEYDGYLTRPDSSSRHYWMFETRREIERDVIFMMTDALQRSQNQPDKSIFTGVSVSRSQDQRSVPTIWPIVAVKQEEFPPHETLDREEFRNGIEKRFREKYAGLKDPSEIDDWVLEELQSASSYATIPSF